jgi:hypothetical protein
MMTNTISTSYGIHVVNGSLMGLLPFLVGFIIQS